MNNRTLVVFLLPVFLGGCSNDASHLPSPIALPGAIIGSIIDNASYQSKRRKVELYVGRHYLEIRSDANKSGGSALEGALDAAGLSGKKRLAAKNDLIIHKNNTFQNHLLVEDALIHVFAKLYVNESTAKDKRINGFNYIDARAAIRDFSTQNFESLRMSVKQGNGAALDQLASKLHINSPQKRESFKHSAQNNYKRMYLEPVVVTLMAHQ